MKSTLAHLTKAMPPVSIDLAAHAKTIQADHKPDTRPHLRELPLLEQQRSSLVNRITDRKAYIAGYAPVVSELRRLTTVALEELATVTEAAKSGELQGNLRSAVARKKREADKLETNWAFESKALETAEKILTHTEKLLREFDKGPDGARLKKLREMDKVIDSSRPREYRSSGDRHEAGIARTY
jgi:hypothetical protein